MIRLRTFVITPEDVFYIVDIATLSAHVLGKEPAQHDVSPLKLACNHILMIFHLWLPLNGSGSSFSSLAGNTINLITFTHTAFSCVYSVCA